MARPDQLSKWVRVTHKCIVCGTRHKQRDEKCRLCEASPLVRVAPYFVERADYFKY